MGTFLKTGGLSPCVPYQSFMICNSYYEKEFLIFKDETPFEKVKKIVEQAQDKYGDELYSLKMEWRPGFGNSIIFEINS